KNSSTLSKLPEAMLGYWLSNATIEAFASNGGVGERYPVKSGIMTGDDARYLRFWHEMSVDRIEFGLSDANQMSGKFFPLNKGGEFRKWYGNNSHVINLRNNGADIKASGKNYRLRDPEWYFKPYVSWSRITSGNVAFRVVPGGVLFADAAPGVFAASDCNQTASLLNSKAAKHFLSALNPTINFQTGDVERVPFVDGANDSVSRELVTAAKSDWDAYETSWDFSTLPLL